MKSVRYLWVCGAVCALLAIGLVPSLDALGALTDPCKCAASQSAVVSRASGKCGNPQKDCYAATTFQEDTNGLEDGRCFNPDGATCALTAQQCAFGSFTVVLAAAPCSNSCCDDPQSTDDKVRVEMNGTLVGMLSRGQFLNAPLNVTSGPLGCGSPNKVETVALVCPSSGETLFELTFTFRCGQCPNKIPDGE